MTAVTHRTGYEHLAADAGTFNAEHSQTDQATIDEYGIALVNVFGKAWVVDIHAAYPLLADAAHAFSIGKFKDLVLF